MQVTCIPSHTIIPQNRAVQIDLLLSFKTEVTTLQPTRRPLNLSLVIDRSGSMAGLPLKRALEAAHQLVEKLSATDILSVVTYDDHVETLFAPQPLLNKDIVYTLLNKVYAGGCTNLSGGWLKGCEQVQQHQTQEMVNRVLLLTDGQANVGITDVGVLIKTAQQKSAEGIITTTLGFGSHFNEDLLIGMADASGGNFYFIQSPEDTVEIFRIELESLGALIAQDLVVTFHPESTVQSVVMLNKYRVNDANQQISLGDVYATEDKQLMLELAISPIMTLGMANLMTVEYKYYAIAEGSIQQQDGKIVIAIQVGTATEAENTPPNSSIIQQASHLRIAQTKDQAVTLADKGDFNTASQLLRNIADALKQKGLYEFFDTAEEIDQLEHYAKQLDDKRYNFNSRKEMRDQSYQAHTRSRDDLKLRGTTAGDDVGRLPIASSADSGVLVKCFRESGKLRIRVVSEGFNPDFKVQFPRNIREEGITYVVDEIKLSADGRFYRASGEIRRLLLPGQPDPYAIQKTAVPVGGRKPPKAVTAPPSAADLETVDSVGTGVLIQCVQEGKKLRARVVSDGYNPDYNVRFPRSIRELGVLYVVDEVIEAAGGGSYIACGKVRKLVQ
ncbi:MAG: hypothetical protein BWK79_03800 [Beggiatoa sp. IS2]|nr:MAG: hypothetical protein BWK79_03800 [Beggiatoa sp. IS2]